MPAVLMENPQHGRHHFYSPQEVEAAKLNGWTEVVEAPAVEPEAPKPAPKAPPKVVAGKHRKR